MKSDHSVDFILHENIDMILGKINWKEDLHENIIYRRHCWSKWARGNKKIFNSTETRTQTTSYDSKW